MSERAGQIEGPAKWAAVVVLGGVGLLGVGRSFFVDTVHTPPADTIAQPVRIEPVPRQDAAETVAVQSRGESSDVVVNVMGATQPNTETEPAELSASDDVTVRIPVNFATAAELDLLPGIGQVYAERIIAERVANGPFASIEDLQRVRGIGPKTAAKLGPLITFDQP